MMQIKFGVARRLKQAVFTEKTAFAWLMKV